MTSNKKLIKPLWYGDVPLNSPAVQTPMMKQFIELKHKVPDALLFFRMGDFYELFLQDAVDAAEALELTLTSRNKKDANPVPMAGIPYHALENYLSKLVELNYKIAIAEQEIDPNNKIMVRKITRLVTAGIPWNSDMVEADESCWIGAICGVGPYGVSFLDVSTGELNLTEVKSLTEAVTEVLRMDIRELIIHKRLVDEPICNPIISKLSHFVASSSWFDENSSKRILKSVLDVKDLFGFGIKDQKWAVGAAGALISYAQDTAMVDLSHINNINYYNINGHMVMDQSTRQNLEVIKPLRGTGRKGTLLGLIDKTCTAMGARLLRQWLSSPLIDKNKILSRQRSIEDLYQNKDRSQLRKMLKHVYDLERLATKVAQQKINPRELKALANSLEVLPEIFDIISILSGFKDKTPKELGQKIAADINLLIVDEAPTVITEGKIFKKGNSVELDEVIVLTEEGVSAIAKMEEEERVKTGISSLRIRFNRVFGYFLEVTNTHKDKVPEEWMRKQTLANSERYITPELKEFEEKLLGAAERRKSIEHQMYIEFRDALCNQVILLQRLSKYIAYVDVISCLAEVAVLYRYTKPEINNTNHVYIKEGRHPVIEHSLEDEIFVPNDVTFDERRRLIMLTGPNMAGKSTVMRQVALIALLAQIGSYVPAKKAIIGIFDRIFVRVGASDDLSQGRSTFMVEMSETAYILNQATKDSLILLDEIGRGTSTFDGLSIAWAVAESVHDKIKARCIFATHYHELMVLSDQKSNIINMHVAISESNGEIVFLRSLQEGGTGKSYGIQCAQLAGMPRGITRRAKQILRDLERHGSAVNIDQISLFDAMTVEPEVIVPKGFEELQEFLEQVEPDNLTPKMALEKWYELLEFRKSVGL